MDTYILNGIDDELLRAQAALMKVAEKEGVSLETVCNEIGIAIKEAMANGDAHAKALWANCPHIGENPTPEETIVYLSKLLREG